MKRTLPVIGMACASCSVHVERALNGLRGVQSASVSLASRTALIDYDPSAITLEEMKAAINGIGFDLVIEADRSVEAIERRAPRLSIRTGGLSGPAVKPVAVRMVYDVARAVKIPVVGLGGIMTAEDAIEFMMAGATAIEIGTANFIDPAVTIKVRDGINDWLDKHGCHSVTEIIGAAQ